MLFTFTSTPIALTQGIISLTAPGDDIRMTMVVAEASYRELDRRGATLSEFHAVCVKRGPSFGARKRTCRFTMFLFV